MKNNGFWLKFLAGIGIVLLGFAVGYGMLSQKVSDTKTKVKENSEKIIIIDKALGGYSVKLEYIIKAVDEIRDDIKNDP